jgi:hypothetical protein
MTPEARMICHHPVYLGDDDLVAVKNQGINETTGQIE